MDNEIKIFSGSTGKSFAAKVCEYLGVEPGKSDVITF